MEGRAAESVRCAACTHPSDSTATPYLAMLRQSLIKTATRKRMVQVGYSWCATLSAFLLGNWRAKLSLRGKDSRQAVTRLAVLCVIVCRYRPFHTERGLQT